MPSSAPAGLSSRPPERDAGRASRCRSTATPPTAPASVLDTLEQADAEVNCKVQPPVAPGGRFAKDAFTIDLEGGTVICPAGQHRGAAADQATGRSPSSARRAPAARWPSGAPPRASGRTIYVGPYEQQLARARQRQTDPAWKADYKADPPEGRAQDRPPDAPPPRRPPRPGARQAQGRPPTSLCSPPP